MWRKLTAAALVLAALALPAEAVTATVNGRAVDARAVDGTTYVPLRAASRALADCRVSWSGGTAYVEAEGLSLSAAADAGYLTANGRALPLAGGVRVFGGSLYVPARVLAACFGAAVSWDGAAQRAAVGPAGTPIASGDTYYNAEDLYWLARIIHAESQGEPLAGKIAVGNVVRNRVASPEFPDTIHGVIFDRKYAVQFEPVANGTIYDTPGAESVLAAKLVLDGAQALGADCLYFLELAAAGNFWIPQNRAYVTTIGCHSFYL